MSDLERTFRHLCELIVESPMAGHEAHRALDMVWTGYAICKGGDLAEGTSLWMRRIEGHHADAKPYPLTGEAA